MVAEDAAKVWVGDLDDAPIINQTKSNGGGGTPGKFFMNAGEKYNIKIDYTDVGTPHGQMQLTWTRPGLTWSYVPQTQLYPAAATPAATTSPKPGR